MYYHFFTLLGDYAHANPEFVLEYRMKIGPHISTWALQNFLNLS